MEPESPKSGGVGGREVLLTSDPLRALGESSPLPPPWVRCPAPPRLARSPPPRRVLQPVLVLLLLGQRVVVQPPHRLVTLVPRRALVSVAQLLSGVLQGLLHTEHVRLQLVPCRHPLSLPLVLFLVALRLRQHALDLALRQPPLVVLDHDVLAAARAVLLGRHVQDAVGVQVEGHVYLGHSARRRRYAGQVERPQQVVVFRHRSLALVHLDGDGRLVVRVRGERLRLLAGDLAVAFYDLRHHPSGGLDAQRQRSHVHEQHVLDLRVALSAQDGRLDRRAVGHRFVRIDGQVELLAAEEVLQQALHLWDASRSTDEHHVVYLTLVHLRIFQSLLDRLQGTAEQVGVEFLEPGAGDPGVEVDPLVQSVYFDRRFAAGRQRPLGALGGGAEASQRARVGSKVFLVLSDEFFSEMIHQPVVKVLASEMRVSSGSLHLEQRALVDGQNGHVEGAAAEIEDQHVPFAFEVLVQAVGECGGCGLVDDAENVQTCDRSGILRRLTLGVVEVSRNCDYSVANRCTEIRLRGLLHLDQHHAADFLGGESLRLALELHLDFRFATVVDHFEGPVLHVGLYLRIIEFAAD
ncbi:LAC protein [Danaus plexippus plexippus]|uniref:LAC protein n=1 Tax=Danaus plexippus plexippus TaxID=278856 RepID=A0A212F994_DANPL|nr:LAC protein [Danaus plexippus plexippus]